MPPAGSEEPTRGRQALERLIVHIAAAINIRALYAGAHPRVEAEMARRIADRLARRALQKGPPPS